MNPEMHGVQFGHLFAKGDTREAAIRAMVVALKEVKIRGEIRTIVDYAVEMIQSSDFVNNNIHTGWLDARIAQHVRPCHSHSLLVFACCMLTSWLWKSLLITNRPRCSVQPIWWLVQASPTARLPHRVCVPGRPAGQG